MLHFLTAPLVQPMFPRGRSWSDCAAETVLIVEDDDNIAFLQSKSLSKAGYQVESAESETAAFDRLSKNRIDLIILDYRLPGACTGIELFHNLHAAGHHQPVIMVTGYGDETVVIEALRAGVRDFVVKSKEYLAYLPIAVERVLEQIRLERRLAESDQQLRHSQKLEAIGKLAGEVAHEFNNLLQAIHGYSQFAMEGLRLEDRRRKNLEQVIAASERAATLTRQLLKFSRREQLRMVDVELNLIVHDLVILLDPLIGDRIAIRAQLSDDIGLLHADAGHIQQMLMNLCLNARDAMPEGGELTIKTEVATLPPASCDFPTDMSPGRYVLLSLTDTGCGMAPEVKEHIFEPFFTTKEVGKGTGLGLAMVYGTVQQHRGTIQVRSEPGAGTTFDIFLPTTDQAAAATACGDQAIAGDYRNAKPALVS